MRTGVGAIHIQYLFSSTLADIVTLFAEVTLQERLIWLLEAVDEKHLAAMRYRLVVVENPQVCLNVGAVKQVLRNGDDSIEQVAVEQRFANIAPAAAGIAVKQWRAIEDDTDTRAVAVHLANHVLQEKQRTIAGAWQSGREAPVLLFGFSLDGIFKHFPLHAERRIGKHIVESLTGKFVVGERVAHGNLATANCIGIAHQQYV